MSHIRSMADRFNSARTIEDIWDVALRFLPDLGLSKVVFFDLSHLTSPRIMSNAGQAWTEGYTSNVKSGHDPFPMSCLSRIDPILTGIAHLEAHPYLDDDARDLVAHGSETLDIRTGMSVTINPNITGAGIGWNLMTPNSAAEFAELREHHEADWRAWCQLTFAGLSMVDQQNAAPLLTRRERDCLAYVADGLRTAEVAHRLGIAETTVEMHLRNARTRLSAKTRDQAVAIAVSRRLI